MLGISPDLHLRYFTGFNGLLILPALYVTTAIHELGHLIAGRIVGMRPSAIMIAGIVIFKSGAHWGIGRWVFQRLLVPCVTPEERLRLPLRPRGRIGRFEE